MHQYVLLFRVSLCIGKSVIMSCFFTQAVLVLNIVDVFCSRESPVELKVNEIVNYKQDDPGLIP